MAVRTAFATLLVIAAGLSALFASTDGLRAFTTESARRLAVEAAPRALPPVTLEDQDGRRFTLDDARGRPVLVDFIYVRCRSVCAVLGDRFAALRDALRPVRPAPVLLSVSFDPAHDDVAALREYAARHGADGTTWRIARIADAQQLASWLDTFGVVVVPDARGEFAHNAAIHVVDGRGRLARILDDDAPAAAVLAGLRDVEAAQ